MRLGGFKVLFSYEKGKKKKGGSKIITRVSIFDEEDKELVTGFVTCSAKDQFCYDTGRKLALKNAFEPKSVVESKGNSKETEEKIPCIIGKEERAGIWEDYRISTKESRWGVKPVEVNEILTKEN